MAFISSSSSKRAHYVRRSTRKVGLFSIGDEVTVTKDVTREKLYAVDKSMYDFIMNSLTSQVDTGAYEERDSTQAIHYSDVAETFVVGMIVGSDNDTYSILLRRGKMISRVPQFYKGASVIELLPKALRVAREVASMEEFYNDSVSALTVVHKKKGVMLEEEVEFDATVQTPSIRSQLSALTAAVASITALNSSLSKRLHDTTVAVQTMSVAMNDMRAELNDMRGNVYRIPKKRKLVA